MDHLAHARDECEWELADICLERYQPVVQSITESLARATRETNLALGNAQDVFGGVNGINMNMDGRNSYSTPLSNIASSIDWFDEPWEHFWLDLFPLADATPPT